MNYIKEIKNTYYRVRMLEWNIPKWLICKPFGHKKFLANEPQCNVKMDLCSRCLEIIKIHD